MTTQLTLITVTEPAPHTTEIPTTWKDYWKLTSFQQAGILQSLIDEEKRQEEELKRIVGYFHDCEHEYMAGPDHYETEHEYHLVCIRCVEERCNERQENTPDNYGWEEVTKADYISDEYIYCDGLCEECHRKLVSE